MITPVRVVVPDPPLGGKPFLLRKKGMFVLEEGPGMLQTINITHAGSGELFVYDGVPNERGFFPDENIEETDPKFGTHNGRVIMQFSPAYMGAWMSNAGFRHGLTVFAHGGNSDLPPFATCVWQAVKVMKQPSKLPPVTPKPEPHSSSVIKDIKTAPFKSSLMRTVNLNKLGVYRISRRDAEMYSVLITHNGSFCRMIISDGDHVPLFDQFSTFTGSFVCGMYGKNGLIVDLEGKQQPPLIQVNYREQDLQVV